MDYQIQTSTFIICYNQYYNLILLKINRVLIGALAIVLVAGLVVPASATEHIDKNIDDSFTATQLVSTATLSPGDILIGFNPLAGPNGTPYPGHVENGFVVTSISGTWQEALNVGNPIPSIFSIGPPAGVNIEKQGGGNFALVSMDVGTGGGGNTGIDVSCTARESGNVVGNHAFTMFGNFPAFPTFAFPGTFSNIDSVDCTVTKIGTTSVNFDNFVVRAASPAAIGGDIIPLDSTMVLVAGAQYTAAWMIPAIVSAIGIGIVIARKF